MAIGGWLADLERERVEFDLDSCTPARLTQLAGQVAKARRLLTGYATDIARAASAHADQSPAAPAPEDVAKGGPKGTSKPEAAKLTRRARALLELPATAATFREGNILVENVDLIVKTLAGLDGESRAQLVASDPTLAKAAARKDLPGFRRWLSRHLDQLATRAGLDRADRQRAATTLSLGSRNDAMHWLNATYDPERGAELHHTIRSLARQLANQRRVPMSDALQAEALYLLVTRTGDDPGRRTAAIAAITDLATARAGARPESVAETWNGHPIPAESIARLACDADLYNLTISATGLDLKVGHTRRHATPAQRLALRALYNGCPLSGEPFTWCDIHHVIPWLEGGPTDLDNLIPVSTAWHHRLHEGGWTLKMAADRTIKLYRPDGTHDRTVPAPIPLTRRSRDGP